MFNSLNLQFSRVFKFRNEIYFLKVIKHVEINCPQIIMSLNHEYYYFNKKNA